MRRRELLAGAAGIALWQTVSAQTDSRAPAVWLDLDQGGLDAAYDQSNFAPTMEQLVARRDATSRLVRERLGLPQRFAYGNTPVETLDVYRARTAAAVAPVHVHIHGGAWRGGRAEQHAFAAELFVAHGAHFVVPDFAWVQDVDGDLARVAAQVRHAVHWVYRNARSFGGDPDRIYVSGHSSGAHLAGVVLTTDWSGELEAPATLVKGGLCCSGMFDLRPVRLSARSSYVHLTDETEAALSPQRHIDRLTAPLIVAYGSHESPEFQRQSRDFAAAVRTAGKSVELIAAEGYNHFEIIETLANPLGLLGRAALAQMGLTSATA
jgi:arylformamidase